MSDLIDLDASSESLPRSELVAPLLPLPNTNEEDAPRPSLGPDNPFDRISRQVDRYICRSEDPFEIVDNINQQQQPQSQLNHSLKHLSISNNTACSPTTPSIPSNKPLIKIIVEPPSPSQLDLSILSDSIMNDALCDEPTDTLHDEPTGALLLNGMSTVSAQMNGTFNSYCSSVPSELSSGSFIMNRAFIVKNLSSSSTSLNMMFNNSSTFSDKIFNNSSAHSDKGFNNSFASANKVLNNSLNINGNTHCDISDIVQKYQRIKNKEADRLERPLINIAETKNRSIICGNAGKGYFVANLDLITKEASKVAENIATMLDSPQDDDSEFISSIKQPDFDDLPLSEDEANDLIQLPISPNNPQNESKKTTDETTKLENGNSKTVVKDMESDLFTLEDPKKKVTVLNLLIDLKNIVKTCKPDAIKLLDDLENNLGLNYTNTDLITICLQGSKSNAEKENCQENKNELEAEKENLNKKIEENDATAKRESNATPDKSGDVKSVFSDLESLLQDKSKIEPSTRRLLNKLSEILSKLTETAEPTVDKSRDRSRPVIQQTKLPSSRRSYTPDGKKTPSTNKVLRRSFSTLSSSQEVKNTSLSATSKLILKPLSVTNKRFSSDPDINSMQRDLIPVKNLKVLKSDVKTKSAAVPETQITKTKSVADIRSKLKRKTDVEPVSKKGPLKAVIPVNSMQKFPTSSPVKKKTLSPMKSTNNLLTPPLASSTPMSRRSSSQIKFHKMSTDKHESPVTNKLEPLKFKNTNAKPKSPRRSRLSIPSPLKYPLSPKRETSKFSKSELPQKLHQPLKMQSNSNSSSTEKHVFHKLPILSPLRTNNQNIRVNPSLQIPKFRANVLNQAVDKENQYL